MPQKKNPDVAELIRGKTGRVYGDLTTLLTLMKGLALTYNKDMQEDKEPLFDAYDTVFACLRLMTSECYRERRFNADRMAQSLYGDFLHRHRPRRFALASVEGGGVPFREAHEIVGGIVRDCIAKKARP